MCVEHVHFQLSTLYMSEIGMNRQAVTTVTIT